MTDDGMTPVLTITDIAAAYMIADALRAQADAKRRVADRLGSPAYEAVSGANVRTAALLTIHAQRLDKLATEAERQGIELESDDAPTIVLPRYSDDVDTRMMAPLW